MWPINVLVLLSCLITVITCQEDRNSSLVNTKIVGGFFVKPGQVPYQVLIRDTSGATCGGSIVGPEWVLTAAHCIHASSTYYVNVGSITYGDGVRHFVRKSFVHPKYTKRGYHHDIALLKMTQRFTYNTNTNFINLAKKPYPSGTILLVSGFGQYTGTSDVSRKLQAILVQTLNDTECARRGTPVTEGKICFLGYNGGGTCFGDSGGPFASDSNEQVGIVSYGISSYCEKNLPAVATNVPFYYSWILSTVEAN